jgi:hypothetical protein
MNDIDQLLEGWWRMSIGTNTNKRPPEATNAERAKKVKGPSGSQSSQSGSAYDPSSNTQPALLREIAPIDPLDVYVEFKTLEKTFIQSYNDEHMFTPPLRIILAPNLIKAESMKTQMINLTKSLSSLILHHEIDLASIDAYVKIQTRRKELNRFFVDDPYTEMMERVKIIMTIVSYVIIKITESGSEVRSHAQTRSETKTLWEVSVISDIERYGESYVGVVANIYDIEDDIGDSEMHVQNSTTEVEKTPLIYGHGRSVDAIRVELNNRKYRKVNKGWLIDGMKVKIRQNVIDAINSIFIPHDIESYTDDEVDIYAFRIVLGARDVHENTNMKCNQMWNQYKEHKNTQIVAWMLHKLKYEYKRFDDYTNNDVNVPKPRIASIIMKLSVMERTRLTTHSTKLAFVHTILSDVVLKRVEHILQGCPIYYMRAGRKYGEFLSHVDCVIEFFNAFMRIDACLKAFKNRTNTPILPKIMPKIQNFTVWVDANSCPTLAASAAGSLTLFSKRRQVLRQAFHIYTVMCLCRSISNHVIKIRGAGM